MFEVAVGARWIPPDYLEAQDSAPARYAIPTGHNNGGTFSRHCVICSRLVVIPLLRFNVTLGSTSLDAIPPRIRPQITLYCTIEASYHQKHCCQLYILRKLTSALLHHLIRSVYFHRLCGLVVRFLATDPEAQVRFPAIPDFLSSSGSGTGFTQPCEHK
jgi:hypothetical protein